MTESQNEIITINETKAACTKVAHEIKNPLTLIRSTLQLIEKDIPEVKTHKYWPSLYDEISLINRLLNDFNSLSNFELDFLIIDLGEVIQDICQKFEPLFITNNIKLNLVIPQDILNINGDEFRLVECFTNLIKNAVEAIEDNNGNITITLETISNMVRISITDNGCGIKEENVPLIFTPFKTFKENGTGLGLPIVKSIIEQHNGLLTFETEYGIGTTFNVDLPLQKLI